MVSVVVVNYWGGLSPGPKILGGLQPLSPMGSADINLSHHEVGDLFINMNTILFY